MNIIIPAEIFAARCFKRPTNLFASQIAMGSLNFFSFFRGFPLSATHLIIKPKIAKGGQFFAHAEYYKSILRSKLVGMTPHVIQETTWGFISSRGIERI